MSGHRYAVSSLIFDYLRAGVGLAMTAGPLLFADPSATAAYVLAALALLFAIYGGRTVARQMTTIEHTASGLQRQRPGYADLAWSELAGVSLRYYSTRRDRRKGWMQLRLRGAANQRIHIDSTLGGFEEIAVAAARAARARGIELDEATRGNLAALGATTASGARGAEFG